MTTQAAAGRAREIARRLLTHLWPKNPDEMLHYSEGAVEWLAGQLPAVAAALAGPGEQPATYKSERMALVAEVGECCRGTDPLCSAECLVEKALLKRAIREPTREQIAEALEAHDRAFAHKPESGDYVTATGKRYYRSMADAVLARLQRREGA